MIQSISVSFDPVISTRMFLTLLVLFSSCLLNTINAEDEYPELRHPHPKPHEACFLPDTSEQMQKLLSRHPALHQINIITCQPHEVCSSDEGSINIGAPVKLG